MEIEGSVIETGVDKLVNLVKQRGKIALADAAKELGVSPTVIQEWVDFLEEEGIISVQYNLTKPFLVERKLTKKELEEKAKEFASKKDVFVRKAEVNLSFLEKHQEELKKIKQEFDKMKQELGLELDTVKSELKELENYQQLRQELQRQIEEQKTDTKAKIEELIRQITTEKRRYQELITDTKKEREELRREKIEAKSIEESEKVLNKRLAELKDMISLIEKRVTYEDSTIKNSEAHLDRLTNLMEDIKKNVAEGKSSIDPLLQKSREHERKVTELQNEIVKKIAKNQKDMSSIREITQKVNDFFSKKLAVIDLVDKVNKDRDDLEKSLIDLIKKAKAFQLTSKGDMGKEMIDLEKKFTEVDKKKGVFEEELKKFASMFRTKT